jgi:multisubunit Na+/H+ antiporter MnhF subunit
MNVWLIGATALIAGLVPCLVVALRARDDLDALVALETTSVVVTLVLVLLAEGFHRPAYFTLPLTLAVLSFVGGLVYARLLGRWL